MDTFGITLSLIIITLGPILGSYFAAQVMRLEKITAMTGKRSGCDHCGHELAWYELIPILSFIIQRGKCRYCRERIDVRIFFSDILGLVVFAIFGIGFYQTINWENAHVPGVLVFLLVHLFIAALMLYMAVYDLFTYSIPSKIVNATLVWVFVVNILAGLLPLLGVREVESMKYLRLGGPDNLLAAVLAAASLWLVVRISGEKAMGIGDVYLAAIIGAGLGWPGTITAFYVMLFSALISGLAFAIHKGHYRGLRIPLVPFIALGYVSGLMFGHQIFAFLFPLL